MKSNTNTKSVTLLVLGSWGSTGAEQLTRNPLFKGSNLTVVE